MINVGDKFIIEIDKVFEQDGEKLYRAKGFKSLVFDQKGLDKLISFQDEDEEINVGDVIITDGGYKAVVTSFHDIKKLVAYITFGDGSCGVHSLEGAKKIGKHIDIKSILEQIEEV